MSDVFLSKRVLKKKLAYVFSAWGVMPPIRKSINEAIEKSVAADVAPVVHGRWYYNENGRDFGLGAWACSCCDTCNHNIPGNPNINPYIWSDSKFCPNCGAKMDG